MTSENLKIKIDFDGILNMDKRRTKYNNTTEQDKKALKFIEKLSKNFTVIFSTAQNEILAAKWLIDNDANSLIPCLLNKEEHLRCISALNACTIVKILKNFTTI